MLELYNDDDDDDNDDEGDGGDDGEGEESDDNDESNNDGYLVIMRVTMLVSWNIWLNCCLRLFSSGIDHDTNRSLVYFCDASCTRYSCLCFWHILTNISHWSGL